jgi:hypothetical protein
MAFSIRCHCGVSHPGSASQAGTVLLCSCGAENRVPSLGELRRASDLPAYEMSVSDSLLAQLAAGEVGIGDTCVECGRRTDETLLVVAVCEQAHIHSSGGVGLSICHIPVAEAEYREEVRGRNTSVPVPIRICSGCVNQMWHPRSVHAARIIRRPLYIAAVAVLVLELVEPVLPFDVPGRLSVVPLAAAALFWLVEVFLRIHRRAKLRATMHKVAAYEELLREYPDTELHIMAGKPEDS